MENIDEFMKLFQEEMKSVLQMVQEEAKIIEEEGMEDISITFADGSSGTFQYPTKEALKRLSELHNKGIK